MGGWGGTGERAYLIGPGAEDEQVEGNGRYHVDEEPALEVVDGDARRVAHHLLVDVDVGGAEVDEDVHDEHDVHHQVHHVERRARIATLTPLLLLTVVEQEGGSIGRENGGVDDQQQDEPVPHRLEGAVVQDGEAVHAGGLQLVLREHVGPQGQHLERRARGLPQP